MLNIRTLTTAAALMAIAGFAQAHDAKPQASWQNGIHRTDLTRHDLEVPGYEAIQVLVDFEPGVASPRHSHPGAEVAHVISGTFEYQLEGRPNVILKAGESLFIPAGTAHVATNVGKDKASELATYIVKKGQPLLKLEE
ncbi:cupin domain-containing protein [Pseudomonas sp. JS3066]|jgi:quercetin dioxygenase-like cupin family protein|uniref:cupin domain-containing protein n=1 Tax=unclassified Pseudomonas TaxID=196821 RepID=UPI000EAA3E4F|nr:MULTISPECIES: cupin domain-containing protein [unclassified Pseudomonas]AYF86836.1 cupin domain-containing protein [Pseudomonas sp. DY-1]MDH4652246.1 cupin domain-containing protein [Pseudomonas sp. BN606]MRK21847.1 cupin domain-containing protein [Pseudomonas sp. JG-B]WVK95676.1 cupin domain-containing protein [Pseudomonas sp. JS3066]